jgi:hypothetical protein
MRSASRFITSCTAALLFFGLIAQSARAEEYEFAVVIKDHRFAPAELIVPGNGRIVVFVGPLKPGKYEFFGEFNMATARGWLVAR